jgi:cytochrome c-type biogenesis protein CcmH/NrfF
MRSFIALAIWFVCGAGASALALQSTNLAPPPMPRAQAEIYAHVTSRVFAPCCWSQPVQTHQSDAAEKVRAEVVAYIRQGAGEQEIFDGLAAEYGERILGEPRGARNTVAFVTPFVILVGGLGAMTYALFRLSRRRPRPAAYTGLLPDLPESDP